MKLTFHHKGRYTSEIIPIEDVIASLQAQKEILTTSSLVLSELDYDIEIDDIKIFVEELKSGTLSWDFLIEIYGKYQDRVEGLVVGNLEEMFGIDIPESYEPLVTLVALAITYMVARYAYERLLRANGRSAPSVHIKGENNVVIQNIAQIVNQSPEAVEKALDRAVPLSKRQSLLPRVADFLRPARKEHDAKIEIEGAPDISREALKEFPSDAELKSIDDSRNIDVHGAKLEIRATDRDRNKTGWGAMIHGDERFKRRLPMDLYPTVDADALAENHFIRGDLIVECDAGADGQLKPKRIHLISWDPASE